MSDEHRTDHAITKGAGERAHHDSDHVKDPSYVHPHDDTIFEKHTEENGARKNDRHGVTILGGSILSGNNLGGGILSGSGLDGIILGGILLDTIFLIILGDIGIDDDNPEFETGDGDEGNESGDSGIESEN